MSCQEYYVVEAMLGGDERFSKDPRLTYLIRLFLELDTDLQEYDGKGDVQSLLRGLQRACEGLQRLDKEDAFWKLVSAPFWNGLVGKASPHPLRMVEDFDKFFPKVLDLERRLLTQAGMAPDQVAHLLGS